MEIEIFSKLGLLGRKYYFRIRASNGEIIAQSESYTRRETAANTVVSICKQAGDAKIFHFK